MPLYSVSADINSRYLGVSNQTLAILVNRNDPESLQIAKYYQQARLIQDSNIIYLEFSSNLDELSVSEFEVLTHQIEMQVSDNIQAYAVAWRRPWKVGCMSITSALSLGFNESYCASICKHTRKINYFNSSSLQPYTDYKIRPAMLLSAESVDEVFKLIDRGVSSDYLRPFGVAYLLNTSDIQRNVRSIYYPGILSAFSNLMKVKMIEADAIKNRNNVMFYFTGVSKVGAINDNIYLPGAIADHLTSYGGQLFGGRQMSVLDWIEAGVTGTYGSVVEPCNYVQKFPNPEIVMKNYLLGSTLIEAYWKSVQMPGQGVFVGEPLAAPYKGCKGMVNQQGHVSYIPVDAGNYVVQGARNCN